MLGKDFDNKFYVWKNFEKQCQIENCNALYKILMKRLEIVGASFAELTLHPGMGNFRDIEVEDLTKHKPDSEEMYIDEECCTLVNEANARHNNVFAVGTTSLKALETAMTIGGKIKPYKGWTNKFIFPPYTFSVANCMITASSKRNCSKTPTSRRSTTRNPWST